MKKKIVKKALLLTEDVFKLGRKGDVVHVKLGFAKNFLLPQHKATMLDKRALRIRDALKEERRLQAESDKQDALAFKDKIQGTSFNLNTKVDPDGNMYGSISSQDLAEAITAQGFEVSKSAVALLKPIRKVGTYQIHLSLKEGVRADIEIVVEAE